jgi:xanthine dehydrogenase small subunit
MRKDRNPLEEELPLYDTWYMNHELLFFLNGQPQRVAGRDAFLTLTEYLRQRRGLVGTKVMCSEGDCGACTVLVGRPADGTSENSIDFVSPWVYRSIDACIHFLFQLDGAHVVTVEGLLKPSTSMPSESASSLSRLTPIQMAMVSRHGSQCGYCTPGFVMAMASLVEEYPEGMPSADSFPSPDSVAPSILREGLSGNLCRCTGYTAIEESFTEDVVQGQPSIEELYPSSELVKSIQQRHGRSTLLQALSKEDPQAFVAANLVDALEYKDRYPGCTIIAGATDVGVWYSKGKFQPKNVLVIHRIPDLLATSLNTDQETNSKTLCIGAAVNWEDVRKAARGSIPYFDRLLSLFGSPQIRHAGTIGGNIVNGSPIADSLPCLLLCDAKLELSSFAGSRIVSIHDFYTGYKQTVMQSNELLTRIRIEVPPQDAFVRLYKVSRRRDMDISTFTAAVLLRIVNASIIGELRIVLGGVAGNVLRFVDIETQAIGKPWSLAVATEIADALAASIAPISDVRGSADYRRLLAKNIFLRFYFESIEQLKNDRMSEGEAA